MFRLGISQRLDCIAGRDEARDALDCRWSELLWGLGVLAVPLPSGIADYEPYFSALNLDGFILSGGNDIGAAPQRDALEAAVLRYAERQHLPVLGVCRGMQFINHYLGGGLADVRGHVASRHVLKGKLANGRDNPEVNSYHNHGVTVQTLGDGLNVIAMTEDHVVEAFEHERLPWLGIMWHPEREQPFSADDLKLIRDFFGV